MKQYIFSSVCIWIVAYVVVFCAVCAPFYYTHNWNDDFMMREIYCYASKPTLWRFFIKDWLLPWTWIILAGWVCFTIGTLYEYYFPD